jgi:Zn finger protein HypA/HybF involved in hydrogenase expression
VGNEDFATTILLLIVLIVAFVLTVIYQVWKNGLTVGRQPSKTKKWLCEHCGTQSKAEQIKFGLCPTCGKKIKKFRGIYRLVV